MPTTLNHEERILALDFGAENSSPKRFARLERYRRFLILAAEYRTIPLIPSKEIEREWVRHVLQTQKYQADMYYSLGYFLHVFPLSEVFPSEEEVWTAFAHTCSLYRRRFGMEIDGSFYMSKEYLSSICGRYVASHTMGSIAA